MPALSTIFGRTLATTIVLALACAAQVSPKLGPAPSALTKDQQRDAERVSNIAAKQFQQARKQAKLPGGFWRFRCSIMQRAACTAARNGTAAGTGHPEFQTLYWTDDPTEPSPELERVAAVDTREEKNGSFQAERFSVVVWPTDQPKGYWIGIDLHPNALAEKWHELKAYLLTCDGPCPPPPIAPECEKVQ